LSFENRPRGCVILCHTYCLELSVRFSPTFVFATLRCSTCWSCSRNAKPRVGFLKERTSQIMKTASQAAALLALVSSVGSASAFLGGGGTSISRWESFDTS